MEQVVSDEIMAWMTRRSEEEGRRDVNRGFGRAGVMLKMLSATT